MGNLNNICVSGQWFINFRERDLTLPLNFASSHARRLYGSPETHSVFFNHATWALFYRLPGQGPVARERTIGSSARGFPASAPGEHPAHGLAGRSVASPGG